MRYTLKPLTESDYLKFFKLIDSNRSRLKKYFPNTIKENQTKNDSKDHLCIIDKMRNDKQKYLFGIFDLENLIGYINVKNIDKEILKCELGYFIDIAYEGKGIMTLQIKRTIAYCFEELGMNKVFLRIGEENIASKILAEKNGFVKEGVLRNEFRLDTGEFVNLEYHGILNPKNLV